MSNLVKFVMLSSGGTLPPLMVDGSVSYKAWPRFRGDVFEHDPEDPKIQKMIDLGIIRVATDEEKDLTLVHIDAPWAVKRPTPPEKRLQDTETAIDQNQNTVCVFQPDNEGIDNGVS